MSRANENMDSAVHDAAQGVLFQLKASLSQAAGNISRLKFDGDSELAKHLKQAAELVTMAAGEAQEALAGVQAMSPGEFSALRPVVG